jgi:hypothetical protein
MSGREKLRAETTELQQRLRSDPAVPQALFELLDVMIRRLDRIELGEFEDPSEVPTVPGKKMSSGNIPAVHDEAPLGERVKNIFDEASLKKPVK